MDQGNPDSCRPIDVESGLPEADHLLILLHAVSQQAPCADRASTIKQNRDPEPDVAGADAPPPECTITADSGRCRIHQQSQERRARNRVKNGNHFADPCPKGAGIWALLILLWGSPLARSQRFSPFDLGWRRKSQRTSIISGRDKGRLCV